MMVSCDWCLSRPSIPLLSWHDSLVHPLDLLLTDAPRLLLSDAPKRFPSFPGPSEDDDRRNSNNMRAADSSRFRSSTWDDPDNSRLWGLDDEKEFCSRICCWWWSCIIFLASKRCSVSLLLRFSSRAPLNAWQKVWNILKVSSNLKSFSSSHRKWANWILVSSKSFFILLWMRETRCSDSDTNTCIFKKKTSSFFSCCRNESCFLRREMLPLTESTSLFKESMAILRVILSGERTEQNQKRKTRWKRIHERKKILTLMPLRDSEVEDKTVKCFHKKCVLWVDFAYYFLVSVPFVEPRNELNRDLVYLNGRQVFWEEKLF